MSTFVLVHGGFHGSWCWKRVRRQLQALGHEVFTPTLTGLGERVHLLSPDVGLETHIADVVNLIRWEELSDIVLCGHSYAGCVITGVADRIPDRIGALVYLDAFVLQNGESFHDALPSAMRDAQVAQAMHSGEGWKVFPIPAEVFRLNDQDRDWVNRQCTMQSLASFQQPLRLTGEHANIGNITFILATGWGPSPFAQHRDHARLKGWNTVALDCGHDVMLDLPADLTRELVAVAERLSIR